MLERSVNIKGHRNTKICWEGHAKKLQHDAAVKSALALHETFTVYRDELDRVEVFKYLGRLLSRDDNDV